MTERLSAPPRLLAQTPFVLFWHARLLSTVGYQMMAVAIGWTIYEITGSALDLGLVGLIQFVPAVLFTLIIGHVADRYDRRHIVRFAQAINAAAAITVLAGLLSGSLTRGLLFAVVFLIGSARAFELPASQSLVPATVPQPLLPRAFAAWTSSNQTGVICGPAAGGLIYAFSPTLVFALALAAFVICFVLVTLMKVKHVAPKREPVTWGSVLAGFNFVLKRPRLLGVLSLDLAVVLVGSVTALLPIYASDILNAGPQGLGLLRSAPAIGALLTSILLARFTLERHVGLVMFAAVSMFGLATLGFALSAWLPLSLGALAVLGAADTVSVVIRVSLVQIETPDAMRGRVTAINYLFIGASNTLGDFESGALAALIGVVPAAVAGGIGALLVAGIWMMIFPSLRRVDRYQPAK